MNIQFIEESHTYLVDGIITPSVTELIGKIWMPDKYKGIPSYILKKAASYGDKVHSLIEYWNGTNDVPEDYERKSYEGIALRRYQALQERHDIRAISQEEPVAYIVDGSAIYAGKYDLLAHVDGKIAICDYKTTSKYDSTYLSYQLTLYKMAIEQTQGIKIEDAYCIWLPKKKLGTIIPVQLKDEKKLIKEIEDYEANQSADTQAEHQG